MLRRYFTVGLMFLSGLASAQTAEQTLQRKLATINTFSASFEQQVFDAQRQLLQQGKGQLVLKQPAKFRFETTEPEPNVFIGDGETLWFYNELLEQLTIFDAATEVNRTPFV
ncbi:outer membrane lipoprotein chaperone LolA, partial [Rheinheimera baltica]